MEKKLYDAAIKGNKIALHNLLQQDSLLLDRFVTGCYRETPLHVVAMLGHFEFVDELLTRKPELAQELNSQKSSPLHLATSKGYLQIVKRLVEVNPDMCHACDLDGRNPLHIAAMKGHLDVLKELIDAKPWAARSQMEDGETILHACVRYKQLESLKFLVETVVSDHDLVNCQNRDGNTILHLAIAANQTEAINFLISGKTVDVNCVNEDGLTALDLLSQNERDVKEEEIVESVEKMGLGTHAKDKPLSKRQLKAIRTKMLLLSRCDQSNGKSKPKKRKECKRFVNDSKADWLDKKSNTLMLVASLLATMAFQAGINPPSGVWQENGPSNFSVTESNGKNHTAGWSILADNHPDIYTSFLTFNTIGFLASLSIILLLISGLPMRHRFFMWVLMIIMWLAITAMAWVYLQSLLAFTPGDVFSWMSTLRIGLLVWIGLMLLLFLAHTIRLVIRLIKYLLQKKYSQKLVTGLRNTISARRARA